MLKFDLINRRTHLYLGFVLLPWFFVYGFSSLMICHISWFQSGPPEWTVLFDKEYENPIKDGEDIRETGKRILEEHGFRGAFWASRPNKNRINMSQFSFWRVNRLTYFVDEKRLLGERKFNTWDQTILGLHFRGGFIQPTFLDYLWGIIVDLVCIAMILWMVSGIIMWWKIRNTRLWGSIAIAGGFISFIFFMLAL